ncbi:tetratricopeptide repeat protein (plasmid) [Streptomyces phaeoluteigriseus]|uniref:Tetratricopeptide repeat protein n=1 Tax=Streptomyces phaeoluteigriseus TaxID=114686 RepID=A0ABY4ZMX1_9ACTN|nr:tetratricopeptide repeat protein [Streptomyces phaeoluteigriseus]USQ89870.1 tetratricopeptide repeat protein [Streptomyces phaeoluteigriseus]
MGGKGSKAKKRKKQSGAPDQRAEGRTGGNPGRADGFSGGHFSYAAAQQRGTQYNTFVQQYAPAPSALDALPELPAEFTGRDEDLAPLLDLLAPTSGVERPVAVVAGMGGVGKTTLAHAVGHQVLEHGWFTGVLLVDLRGYDPQPAQPEQSLDALLRRLGVLAEHIPPTAADREVFYRSHLAERGRKGERLLVITDNASSAAQVRPLLPPAPHGMIATSRKALPGIGRPRTLHQLQPEDAIALLDLTLREANPDDSRVEEDREAAERVATACGCLPLALQIVAALLVQDPGQPLAERADRLTTGEGRLDSINDGERNLRTIFDQTLNSLLPQQQDLFRMLSLNAGPDISTPAAAALTHQSETAIDNQLSQLAAAHLISRGTTRNRWQMHDLLRDYAKEQAQKHLQNNRTANRKYDQARQRLDDYYVKFSEDAKGFIDFSKASQHISKFSNREEALLWMDTERSNLIATAHSNAPSEISGRLCFALTEYLRYRGLHHDALAVSALCLDTVRALKIRINEPGAWGNLGHALTGLHRYEEALDAHVTARALLEGSRDTASLASAWNDTGNVLRALHRYEEALSAQTTARTLHEQTSNTNGQANAWNNTGVVLQSLHRYEEALNAHTTARNLYEQNGNTNSQAIAWNNTGNVLQSLHRYEEALNAYTTARNLYEQNGNTNSQAIAWNNTGNVLQSLHRYDEALNAHTTARNLHEQTSDTNGQANAWNSTGVVLQSLHRYDEALNAHTTARNLHEQTSDTNGQANAWNSTGSVLQSLHRYDEALNAHTTARNLHEQTSDTDGQANAWNNTGSVLQSLHRYEEALNAHTTARNLYEQTSDTDGQATTWNNTGSVLQSLHRYEEALNAHTTARNLYEQTGNTDGQANAWNNTGNVFQSLNQYEEALNAHTTARNLYEQTGNTDGQANAWNNTGNALQSLHRYDEALNAHTTARNLHEQTGNTNGQATTWNNTGTALRALQRYTEAVSDGRHAAEMLESLGNFELAGEALGELATSLDAADASPALVRDAWLRSANAYQKSGVTEKEEQSRANAAAKDPEESS